MRPACRTESPRSQATYGLSGNAGELTLSDGQARDQLVILLNVFPPSRAG